MHVTQIARCFKDDSITWSVSNRCDMIWALTVRPGSIEYQLSCVFSVFSLTASSQTLIKVWHILHTQRAIYVLLRFSKRIKERNIIPWNLYIIRLLPLALFSSRRHFILTLWALTFNPPSLLAKAWSFQLPNVMVLLSVRWNGSFWNGCPQVLLLYSIEFSSFLRSINEISFGRNSRKTLFSRRTVLRV